jgi:hypothetical protein
MGNPTTLRIGKRSVIAAIAGIVSLAFILATDKEYRPWTVPICGLVFLILELLALILGIIGKGSTEGKVGIALSGILLGILMVISLLVLVS